jgi:hypothetical protein
LYGTDAPRPIAGRELLLRALRRSARKPGGVADVVSSLAAQVRRPVVRLEGVLRARCGPAVARSAEAEGRGRPQGAVERAISLLVRIRACVACRPPWLELERFRGFGRVWKIPAKTSTFLAETTSNAELPILQTNRGRACEAGRCHGQASELAGEVAV